MWPRKGGRSVQTDLTGGVAALQGRKYYSSMDDDVQVPYALEELDSGVWLGYAYPKPGEMVWGRGATREEAIADIRVKCLEALTGIQHPKRRTDTSLRESRNSDEPQ